MSHIDAVGDSNAVSLPPRGAMLRPHRLSHQVIAVLQVAVEKVNSRRSLVVNCIDHEDIVLVSTIWARGSTGNCVGEFWKSSLLSYIMHMGAINARTLWGVRYAHTPTHQPLSGCAPRSGPRVPAPPYGSASCRVAASAILRHGLLSGR